MPLSWLLAAFLAAGATPQDQPDFSGRWILADPASPPADVAQSLTIEQPVVRTNVRGEPMPPSFLKVTVRREFAGGTRVETYWIGVEGGTVSGAVPGQPAGPSRETRSSVRWKGRRLVFEESIYPRGLAGGASSAHTEAWELDDDGHLVMTITEARSGAEPITRTLRYRRQRPDDPELRGPLMVGRLAQS